MGGLRIMIALIPVFSESPGHLSLYLRNLAGKPLVFYTIEAAQKSRFIERILILTDLKEIIALANSSDTEVLFQKGALPDQLLNEVIENYHKENQEIGVKERDFIILDPATPLRDFQDIDAACELFQSQKIDSLVSCNEIIYYSSFRAGKIRNGSLKGRLSSTSENILKDGEKSYILNNSIYIFSYPFFKANGQLFSEESQPYVLSDNHSLEIYSSLDFEFAEFLVVKNNKESSSLKENDHFKVLSGLSIRESIKNLDNTGIGFIAITNEKNKVIGIVTDGDFRRAVLTGVSLDDAIITIANRNFIYLNEGYTKEELEKIFYNNDIAQVPVIKNGELKEIILRKNIPFIKSNDQKKDLEVPVVIMAGGVGTRLKPFTHVMPKPLIPIGNKPLIEIIIERFQEAGVREFYLSLNYKANMIKAYFEGRALAKNLHYVTEEFPMGTAGALKKLRGIIQTTFFVSNCDIIIKSDYNKILDFHYQGKYDLTLVACMQHFKIPYGICSIEEGGYLKEISEKPEFDYLVNTGMYVLEPEILDLIPDNTFYHITQLIDELKRRKGKIGVYPVYENSWIDVGQWEEYRKALKYLE